MCHVVNMCLEQPSRCPCNHNMNLKYLSLEQRGSIFIITLRNGEDNRLNGLICREIIAALDHIRETLGTGSEGAVIVQGNNAKFFTNVSYNP